MINYYRLMLGRKSVHSDACLSGGFVGTDFGMHFNLSGRLPDAWRDFNKEFIPVYLENHPDKSKIAAGLACGAIWTVSKGMNEGDIILCPDGTGQYHVGEIVGGYYYKEGDILPHRRKVNWTGRIINRIDMSEYLRNSCGSIGTVSSIFKHYEEIEKHLQGIHGPTIISNDQTIEDPSIFALEKHLEDFLVTNWNGTELSQDFDIFEEEGERVGQQFPTDTGPIDILAVSKDRKTLLVIELKKGRASDVVVGLYKFTKVGYTTFLNCCDSVEDGNIPLPDFTKYGLSNTKSITPKKYESIDRVLLATFIAYVAETQNISIGIEYVSGPRWFEVDFWQDAKRIEELLPIWDCDTGEIKGVHE